MDIDMSAWSLKVREELINRGFTEGAPLPRFGSGCSGGKCHVKYREESQLMPYYAMFGGTSMCQLFWCERKAIARA